MLIHETDIDACLAFYFGRWNSFIHKYGSIRLLHGFSQGSIIRLSVFFYYYSNIFNIECYISYGRKIWWHNNSTQCSLQVYSLIPITYFTLFWFISFFLCSLLYSLNSTYEWNHNSVCHWLIYFTLHYSL